MDKSAFIRTMIEVLKYDSTYIVNDIYIFCFLVRF